MAGLANNPIERLMIYHTGLLPPGGLDESASLAELGENILYYFDSATMATSTVNRGMENYSSTSTEEAVKFLGLATALHSLPLNLINAIRSGEGELGRDDDGDSVESGSNVPTNTHQVHLVHSTLVFVPLEEEYVGCNGLVAVAQIPRAGTGIAGSDVAVGTGGDPVAIRAMIQRKHSAFCLLRGGSVHFRLSTVDEAKFNRQLCDGDAIDSNRPSPRAAAAASAADRNRRDAARAASVAAAEAVAQGDAAWMERWGQPPLGEADDMQNGIERDARGNNNAPGTIARGGRSDVAVSLLRQQNSFAPIAISAGDHVGDDNVDAAKATDAYPGIAMLYKNRKELRKLSERLTASRIDAGLYDSSLDINSATKIRILEEKVASAQERVDALLAALPLSSLKQDLRAYYGNVVASAGTVCALLAGQSVGRCVVDLIPSPGLSSPPSPSCPPNDPPPSTATMLNRIARALLGRRDGDLGQKSLMRVDPVNVSTKSARDDSPLLLGISSFYRGQFLFSNISPEMCMNGEARNCVKLSNDMVSIIHRHFFRGCVSEETNEQLEGSHGSSTIGSFVSPPRVLHSFDASGYEVLESIYILSLGDIWLPQVTLPLFNDENRGVESELLARVALFKCDAYEFLMFLNGDEFVSESVTLAGPVATSTNRGLPMCKLRASLPAITVITSLSRQLQDVLQRMPILYADRVYRGEPGSNVVYVDRLANKVVLFRNDDANKPSPSDANNGVIDNNAIVTNGDEIDFGMRSSREFLRCSDDDLDCRHLLASRLPLDVVLALDEMMKEVRQSSSHQKTKGGVDAGGSRIIELCTFLPQGWVFCRAHEHRELFGVFDPSVYVTLTDVQKATMRIRRELGGVML
mmetsp:Transcript_6846/g.19121  ORF Transcript_6846/g.19121 Transcript_6846/m.19121 type:complete len:864 (+) Transcript_6846:94-2685(+)